MNSRFCRSHRITCWAFSFKDVCVGCLVLRYKLGLQFVHKLLDLQLVGKMLDEKLNAQLT